MEPLLQIESVSRRFSLNNHSGAETVIALNAVSLRIERGEFLAITGPSGSGKSTLLNLIGCIDQPSSGTIHMNGTNTTQLAAAGRAALRRSSIGFVFQTFNLIPVFTAAENVEYPLLLAGMAGAERRKLVLAALASVGMSHRADHRPDLLSGGERQRVAVARAIVHRPALVLADEPTANLDTHNATHLIELMRELNQKTGQTFVFSTHDARLLEHTPRIVRLTDGVITRDTQDACNEVEEGAVHA